MADAPGVPVVWLSVATGGVAGLGGKKTFTVQALKAVMNKPANRTNDFLTISPF